MRLLFFVYVARDFLKLVPWFLLNFIGVHGLGMDGWYFLCIFDHFVVCFWVVYLSELVKYLHIERHLAAKTGTNFAVLI